MSAKTELLDHLKYLDGAVNLPEMVDIGVAPSEHNGAANLLRKGLGIVAFNLLEDFIKNKSLETLSHVSSSGINFSLLSDKLQEAAITGALDALTFRARIKKKDGGDWKNLVQTETLKIHSTKNATFDISKYSLVSANSNITSREISELLKAFDIGGGWDKLKYVSNQINGGIPDLNQSFTNAFNRRHKAAHTTGFIYEFPWLKQIKNEIKAMAASLDILLSARCRQIDCNLYSPVSENNIDDALNFRFLEEQFGKYRETRVVADRSRKNWISLEQALSELKPKLKQRNEFLIVLDSSKRIENWYVE